MCTKNAIGSTRERKTLIKLSVLLYLALYPLNRCSAGTKQTSDFPASPDRPSTLTHRNSSVMFSVVVFVLFVCFVVDDSCFFHDVVGFCCCVVFDWQATYLTSLRNAWDGPSVTVQGSGGPYKKNCEFTKLDNTETPKSLLPLHAPLHWPCIWDPKQKTAHFTNAKKQMTTILSFWYYLHFSPQLLYTDLLILYNTAFLREIMLIRISERFTHDPIFTFALTKGGCHQRAATAFSLEYESSTSTVQIYSHWNIFLAGKTIYLGSPFPHSWKGNCNLMLGVSRKQKPLYLYPVKTFQIKCMT